jgi:hypothetical protein
MVALPYAAAHVAKPDEPDLHDLQLHITSPGSPPGRHRVATGTRSSEAAETKAALLAAAVPIILAAREAAERSPNMWASKFLPRYPPSRPGQGFYVSQRHYAIQIRRLGWLRGPATTEN